MSRRKGTRKAPKPVKQAYVESLHRTRRRGAPATDPGEPISMARRWGAVSTATVMLLFAFAGVVTAIVEQDNGNTSNARGAVIVAAIIAPVSVFLLALISRTPAPLRVASRVAPVAMAGFLLLATLLREPATAVVTAFGIGGAFVLRMDEGVNSRSRRIWVVGVLALLTLVAYRFAPDVTIVVAPLLPFAGCAAADMATERSVSIGRD